MGTAGGRARVLVVDDDQHSGATLTAVLGAAGFETAAVRSTRLAMRVLRDEDVAVVVVSFAGRGVADTTDLVTKLRSRPEPRLGQVGIVSIVDDHRDGLFGLDVESDGLLVRPCAADQLVDVVTEVAAADPTVRSERRARRAGTSGQIDLRDVPAAEQEAAEQEAAEHGGPLISSAGR